MQNSKEMSPSGSAHILWLPAHVICSAVFLGVPAFMNLSPVTYEGCASQGEGVPSAVVTPVVLLLLSVELPNLPNRFDFSALHFV